MEKEKDKNELLAELKNNPRVKDFLANYDERSVDHFLESYANTKHLLLKYGENWRQQGDFGNYRDQAEEYYWLIAQKKLFNLQCQWRGEEIELPIGNTFEFGYWSRNIKSCPFIEDVTEEEIHALVAYLEQSPYDQEDLDPWNWQEYDDFKDEAAMGAGEEYPLWYEFYDNYFGTGRLIALPNLRGDQEERYMAAWRKSLPPSEPTIVPTEQRAFLSADSDTIEEFIKKTEPYKILDYYRLYRKENEWMDIMESVRWVTERLMAESEPVHIPEGAFPDVLFQAEHQLKISYIRPLLIEIHQNHLERKAMGISYEPDHRLENETTLHDITKNIEKGRQLLGE